jgi:hypothetical protein
MVIKSIDDPYRLTFCFVESALPATQRSKNSHEMYLKYQGPRKPADDATFLTGQEAAYILRVSYKTILEYAARKKNRPPIWRPSRATLRFPRQALIQWAAKQGR